MSQLCHHPLRERCTMSNTDNPLPPSDPGVDWTGVRDEVAASLIDTISSMAVGAAADMQEFTAQVSADIVSALQADRPDLVSELRGQLKAKAEALRLEASDFAWQQVSRTINGITSVAFKILAAGVV